MWGAIFSFMFVDLFDSVGTIVACSYEAGMVDEDGSIASASTGCSRPTRWPPSPARCWAPAPRPPTSNRARASPQGARTGLANVVTGVLFLAALFFTPLIGIVPAFATAPALIVVGVFMFRNVAHIDFRVSRRGVPAFLTIILMPLTYSISMGLAFGFIAYIVCYGGGRKDRDDPSLHVGDRRLLGSGCYSDGAVDQIKTFSAALARNRKSFFR